MNISSKIENGLGTFIIKTFDATHRAYEKFQNIRKISPAYSMAMNIIHNAVPFTAGLATHLLLPRLLPVPGLSYITPLVPWLATASCNGKSYLYRDEAKTLDAFIKYFDQLTTKTKLSDKDLNPSHFNPSEFNLTDPVSYHGCMYAIDSLVNLESRKLFNWHSITGENRAPFEKLREALSKSPRDISPDIKKAAQEVISKIIELKAARAGTLTETYKNPSLHPRLKELSTALSQLQSELSVGSPKEATITKIKDLIELTSDTPSIFTQIIPNKDPKIPSHHFMTTLKEFKPLLEAFERLPKTLKTSDFLKGNQGDLQNKLKELLKSYPKPIPIKPASQKEANSAHSPLIQLSEALDFYPDYKTQDNKNALQDHLEQLINTISILYGTDFKHHFLLEIGKENHPLRNRPKDDAAFKEWGEKNLLKATIQDFDSTLKALAQSREINPNQPREALIHALFKD